MKQARHNAFRMLLVISLLALVFPWMKAAAQDDQTPPPPPQEQPTPVDVTVANDKDAPAQTPADQAPAEGPSFDKAPINLATGQTLRVTRSPLRWGHFSVLSLNAMQVYDSNYLFLKNNPIAAHAGAVQGLLVFAIKTGRTNFSVQYRPQVWFSGETTQTDYASHLVDFHASRRLSQEWSLNVSDQYQWSADRGRLDQIGFTADYSTNNINQNPFLAQGRRVLSNFADISLNHNFSAHNTLEFRARHQYIQLSALPGDATAPDPLTVATQEQIFGGEVAWNHAWRRDNSVGIRYAYDREYFQDFTGSAQFHSALFGFSRRLTSSLLLRVTAGPTMMQPATPLGAVLAPDPQFTYQGSAAVFKTFRRSAMSASYSRNNAFTGQISTNLNDRFDASYSQRFFRRLDVVVGGAYIRQELSAGAHLIGKSGWTEIDYRLTPSWSFYTTYSYLTQGGGPLLFGPRQLITSGIRWSWNAGREPYGRM
jgi:hypothetical protein